MGHAQPPMYDDNCVGVDARSTGDRCGLSRRKRGTRYAAECTRGSSPAGRGRRRAAGHRAARGARQASGRAALARPPARAAAAARTCDGWTSTCARCARSTPRWPRTRAAASPPRPPPSGCSTTSTSSRRPPATSTTILPPSFFRRLPRIAADEFAGLPRIYALALELIRLQRGPARRAAAAPLHHGLPVGHAADDRRALGVAERAEAGAASSTCARGPTSLAASRAHRLARRSARRRARDGAPAATTWPARRPSRRSSRACCSARASTARRRRAAPASSTRRWPRAARRSRTPSAPKAGIRRPSRRPWRT